MIVMAHFRCCHHYEIQPVTPFFTSCSPHQVTVPCPWPRSTQSSMAGTAPLIRPSTASSCLPPSQWSWFFPSWFCWAAWLSLRPACPGGSDRSAAAGRRADTSASPCRRTTAATGWRTSVMCERQMCVWRSRQKGVKAELFVCALMNINTSQPHSHRR